MCESSCLGKGGGGVQVRAKEREIWLAFFCWYQRESERERERKAMFFGKNVHSNRACVFACLYLSSCAPSSAGEELPQTSKELFSIKFQSHEQELFGARYNFQMNDGKSPQQFFCKLSTSSPSTAQVCSLPPSLSILCPALMQWHTHKHTNTQTHNHTITQSHKHTNTQTRTPKKHAHDPHP